MLGPPQTKGRGFTEVSGSLGHWTLLLFMLPRWKGTAFIILTSPSRLERFLARLLPFVKLLGLGLGLAECFIF